jgi:hypothetical protein
MIRLFGILSVCARAMNPCLVADPASKERLAQLSVCDVAGSKPFRRKTVAVILDIPKYLGASVPSSSGGHPAGSSAQSRESLCLRAGGVSQVKLPDLAYRAASESAVASHDRPDPLALLFARVRTLAPRVQYSPVVPRFSLKREKRSRGRDTQARSPGIYGFGRVSSRLMRADSAYADDTLERTCVAKCAPEVPT